MISFRSFPSPMFRLVRIWLQRSAYSVWRWIFGARFYLSIIKRSKLAAVGRRKSVIILLIARHLLSMWSPALIELWAPIFLICARHFSCKLMTATLMQIFEDRNILSVVVFEFIKIIAERVHIVSSVVSFVRIGESVAIKKVILVFQEGSFA